jgi:hypothetical protein
MSGLARLRGWIGPVLAVAVLLGMLGTRSLHLAPAQAVGYHDHVAQAVHAVPHIVGDWVGRDTEMPTEAVELLRPNATLCRVYTHTVTGRQATLLIVHAFDARDLQGHYPPVCYPGSGWRVLDRSIDPFDPAPIASTLASYRMLHPGTTPVQHATVLSSFILPDGTDSHDMTRVDQAAGSHAYRHLGGAQVQFFMPHDATPAEQADVWSTFAPVVEPVIDAIQSSPQDHRPASPADPADPGRAVPQGGFDWHK